MTVGSSPKHQTAATVALPAADTIEAEVLRLREINEALTLENRLLTIRLDTAEAQGRLHVAETCGR